MIQTNVAFVCLINVLCFAICVDWRFSQRVASYQLSNCFLMQMWYNWYKSQTFHKTYGMALVSWTVEQLDSVRMYWAFKRTMPSSWVSWCIIISYKPIDMVYPTICLIVKVYYLRFLFSASSDINFLLIMKRQFVANVAKWSFYTVLLAGLLRKFLNSNKNAEKCLHEIHIFFVFTPFDL